MSKSASASILVSPGTFDSRPQGHCKPAGCLVMAAF